MVISPLVLLTVTCALTYSFEIVFGLGGTLMMFPLLTPVFGAKVLVMYSSLPQILVGAIGLARSPGGVRPRVLVPMLAFAALGGLLGTLIFRRVPLALFQTLLACMMIASGLRLARAPHPRRLSPVAEHGLDTLAGASQVLFGVSGPIAMTRLASTFGDRLAIRNHAFAFFLAVNILRLSSYVVQGSITRQIGVMMLVSAPVLAVILVFSGTLHRRISDLHFRRVLSWVVTAGGLSLLLHRG